MTEHLTDEQLAEIAALKFTTGLNAACGHFDTPVERELYDLAAKIWNAKNALLDEITRQRAAWREVHEALIAGQSPCTVMDLMDRHERAAIPEASGGHQSHCVAATQGCCSCDEADTTPPATACTCRAEVVHQAGCDR